MDDGLQKNQSQNQNQPVQRRWKGHEIQKIQESQSQIQKNQIPVNDIHHGCVHGRARVHVQKSKLCLQSQSQSQRQNASSCSSACQSLLRLAHAERLSAP